MEKENDPTFDPRWGADASATAMVELFYVIAKRKAARPDPKKTPHEPL